jgi:MFS family permease
MYQTENAGDLLKQKRLVLPWRGAWISVARTVFLLGLTSLLTDVSSEMVSAILPLYLLVRLQFSPFQVGVTDGLYQGASVLVRMLSGWIADRWRRPKEVAASGYGLSALCKLGFLLAGSSWSAISAVVLSDRIGKGIRTAPRDAMIAASSRTDQLAFAFGVHRAMDTAGAMLGPLVAVAVLTAAPEAYDAIFVVSLCVALIGLAVITLLVENPGQSPDETPNLGLQPPAAAEPVVTLRSMGRLLGIPEFRMLVLIGSALALVTVSDGLLYLALQQRMKIASGLFPMLYVITAMMFMVFAIPAGRLADRIGLKPVFLAGYGLLAAAYGVLLLPRANYALAFLMLTLLGGYYAATDGVFMALASRVLPTHLRATGLALLTTATGLARLLASTLYGALWNWFGAERAFLIFAVGLISMLLLAWRAIHSAGDLNS